MDADLGRLVDALPGLMWTATPDGGAEILGRGWLEYAGVKAEDAPQPGWQQAIHPDDAPSLLAKWSAILKSGRAGEMTARLRRFDGAYRWFLLRASPMTDDLGNVVRWCGINIDIEDRVQAEEAVHERDRHFRSIFDGLPALVTLTSPTGALELANRHVLDFYGVSLDALRSQEAGASFHPDDLPSAAAAWARVQATGAPYDLEARKRRADGVHRWMRLQGFPLHDSRGEVVNWYFLQTDINDAKQAEQKLAAEKSLLEMVARGVPLQEVMEALCRQVEALAPGSYCSILLVNPDGETFSVGAGPSLPGSYNAVLHGKTIDPSYGPCSLAVAIRAPVITADLAKDPRWASSIWPALMAEYGLRSCWSMPIFSMGQEVLGIFAIYRREPNGPTADEQELIDRFAKLAGISIERAQADAALQAGEAEIRQAHSFLAEAQRLSQTGSFIWDVAADDHDWSRELRRIFEFDPAVKVTTPMILGGIHPEDMPAVEALMGAAAQGGDAFDLVFRMTTASGARKHVRVVGHRIEEITDRPVFIGALQDVTRSKLAEEALDRARAELAHVTRAMTLSALTASIAHEVNQPLAGIITNASTCLRLLAADPLNLDGARAAAQRIIRDGNRASEVIQRLRALFTRQHAEVTPVDLNEAAGEVVSLSLSELQRKGVLARTDFAQDLPPVHGDKVQLQQVVLNLVLNGADAMSAIYDRPRDLLITTRCDDGRVRLSVRDAGVGVDPNALEKLFDAFFTTKTDGMGIGLSISRSIIESHEGRLWAAANDGPGATFSFTLPAIFSTQTAETSALGPYMAGVRPVVRQA